VQKENIDKAAELLKHVVVETPLQFNRHLSEKYKAKIYLKREDLQVVRSYKIRGAYNKMISLSEDEKEKGVVCASAGNHAQGVAFACSQLNIKGTIFMPVTTPQQKVEQVKFFGKNNIVIRLEGDTFDDANAIALNYCEQNHLCFVHPFDDPKVMEGQGTIAKEILEQADFRIDTVVFPVGGGGLASGLVSYFKQMSPLTKLVSAEPKGAASLANSLRLQRNTTLTETDKFVDGASVKRVCDTAFELCSEYLDQAVVVNEGKVCTTILQLYNQQAIVAEPAGALSIAALDELKDQLEGKTVVCILSGGNNDISRTEEIRERSLMDQGLKHYFIIRFPQRAGALKSFVNEVLSPGDDIVHFEYMKKNNREMGPAFIGVEVAEPQHVDMLKFNLEKLNFEFEYLNNNQTLLQYLL
jgi:threonine dehydratase